MTAQIYADSENAGLGDISLVNNRVGIYATRKGKLRNDRGVRYEA
jgi:hypothetical protein